MPRKKSDKEKPKFRRGTQLALEILNSEGFKAFFDWLKGWTLHPVGLGISGVIIASALDENHLKVLDATIAGQLKTACLAAITTGAAAPILSEFGTLIPRFLER